MLVRIEGDQEAQVKSLGFLFVILWSPLALERVWEWFTGAHPRLLLARVGARLHDPVLRSSARHQNLVKAPKSPKSLQLLHSIPKINFAKVSSRSPHIRHNRTRIAKRSTGGGYNVHPSEHPSHDPYSIRRIDFPSDGYLLCFQQSRRTPLPLWNPINSQGGRAATRP